MKEKIGAVHAKEVAEFLSSIGLLQSAKSGDLLCHVCGKTLTVDDFGAVTRRKGNLVCVCDDVSCLASFGLHLENGED
jgi:hypothetical protein